MKFHTVCVCMTEYVKSRLKLGVAMIYKSYLNESRCKYTIIRSYYSILFEVEILLLSYNTIYFSNLRLTDNNKKGVL